MCETRAGRKCEKYEKGNLIPPGWRLLLHAASQDRNPADYEVLCKYALMHRLALNFHFEKNWGFQCKMSQIQVKENYFCLILYHCFCKTVAVSPAFVHKIHRLPCRLTIFFLPWVCTQAV